MLRAPGFGRLARYVFVIRGLPAGLRAWQSFLMETLSMEKVSGCRASRPPAPLLPASRTLDSLSRLDDTALLRIVRAEPMASPRRAAACELLVTRHRNLVRSCVARYKHSPEPAEDLPQVGYVGLLKAINNFDPDGGGSLAPYAQPRISGETKRHFRDKRWQVHVERSMQELVLAVREATRQLTQQLGHQPSDAELAEHLGISEADLREARRADMVFQPASLDGPLAGRRDAASLADVLGEEDPEVEPTLDMESVAAPWGELPPR